jgi:NADPH-dependent curcumin reductase CurA
MKGKYMKKSLSSEIHLKRRPSGMPEESDFELVEVPIPEPGDGEVLVRNIYMSVDPYMRGRMDDYESYVAPFQIGEPLSGGCVGQVVESNDTTFQVGDFVVGSRGWREYFTARGNFLLPVDSSIAPICTFLGTVGMPGMTAYVGLLDIGQPKEGETVFVSAAAGAVGSVACQIAKLKGCRVVGSAGSAEKIEWLLDEARIDAAFNYKEVAKIRRELKKLCSQGIDIYFENVGGEHFEAALGRMNNFGRVVMCGSISDYNDPIPPPGPRNLGFVVTKRLTLKGYIISDHYDSLPQFYADMKTWIDAGKLKWRETIVEGLEHAPKAFIGLFKGDNLGKMLVQISPDPTR